MVMDTPLESEPHRGRGRPRIDGPAQMRQVRLRMPAWLVARVDRVAGRRGRSGVIRQALELYLRHVSGPAEPDDAD